MSSQRHIRFKYEVTGEIMLDSEDDLKGFDALQDVPLEMRTLFSASIESAARSMVFRTFDGEAYARLFITTDGARFRQ